MFKMITAPVMALAATLALTASGAGAATISYNNEVLGPLDTQRADATTGTVWQDMYSNIDGWAISPYTATTYANNASYVAVLKYSSATYKIDPTSSFSFLWSTPDTYNTISFYNDGTFVDSVTGSQITTQDIYGKLAAYVTIEAAASFNTVIFASSDNAFEYAIPTMNGTDPQLPAVPVPAAGLLLLSGVAAIGFAKRRRRA